MLPADDRGHVVALVLEEWDRCPGCGQPLSESAADDADGHYRVDELVCAACEVRDRRTRALAGVDAPGLLLAARRKD